MTNEREAAIVLLCAYLVTGMRKPRLDALEAELAADMRAGTPGAAVALGNVRSMRRHAQIERIAEGAGIGSGKSKLRGEG